MRWIELAGVGYAGATRLADNTNGNTTLQGLFKAFFYFGFGLVDGMPFIIINHHFFPQLFQEAPGTALVLHKKHLAFFYRIQYISRQGLQVVFVNKRGNKVYASGCCTGHSGMLFGGQR